MATVTVTHATLTNAPADTSALVDGPKWDAAHTVAGLENVDNTSDANKPVSTAQAAADAVVAANAANASNLTSGTVAVARLPLIPVTKLNNGDFAGATTFWRGDATWVSPVTSLNGQTGALAILVMPQGRLTLTSGTAVTTSDVTGATSVYYALSGGNQVPIYDGTNMVPTVFTELTLALDSTAAHSGYQQSGFNWDLFVINDAGTIRLGTGPSWAAGAVAGSDTARGTGAGSTELQFISGVPTNKNTITIRFGSASGNTVSVSANRATYVGSIRTTADGQTEDSLAKRFVYNAYNQARRSLLRRDPTASWNYSILTMRQANGSTANQVAYLAGLTGSSLSLALNAIIINSTVAVRVVVAGIGIDSTTVSSATMQSSLRASDTTATSFSAYAWYEGAAQLGFHYCAMLEKGNGTDTQTWIGTSGDNISGITGGIFQ